MTGRLLTRRTVPTLVAALTTLGLAPSAHAAVSSSVSGSTLTVTGTAAADVATVRFVKNPDGSLDRTNIIVSGSSPEPSKYPSTPIPATAIILPTSGCTKLNDYDVQCTSKNGNFTSIVANMDDGDDYFSPTQAALPGITMSISGAGGNDFLKGGDLADTVNGGAGNDELYGRGGADYLTPGSGQDDVYGGGGGTAADDPGDVVDLGSHTGDLNITLDGEKNDTETPKQGDPQDGTDNLHSDIEFFILGSGNDTLDASNTPNPVNEVIGNAGADTISTGDGNDRISAGIATLGSDNKTITDSSTADPAANTVNAGAGDDVVTSSTGADTVNAGAGDDNVKAGEGNNTVNGGDGIDTVTTGAGTDTINGDAGNDSLTAGDGQNTVNGGDGNDTVTSGTGNDTVNGDGGDDSLTVNGGDNTVNGGDGNDTITSLAGKDVVNGGAGDDTIKTGDGDDRLIGGLGADSLDGEAGTDELSYEDKTDPVYAKVGQSQAGTFCGEFATQGTCENDTVLNIENLKGGSAGDHLIGSDAVNVITGNGGDDLLEGMGQNDTLLGGEGNDKLQGQDGNDALKGDAGDDNLEGGAGADDIVGGDGSDFVSYYLATAAVTVSLDNTANDGIKNEGDNIHADVENIDGSRDFGDTLSGSDSANVIHGFGGGDSISGLGGNDTLEGGDGGDSISGGAGDDAVTGNAGDDTLDGNLGADGIDGGAGTDLVTYADRAVTVSVTLDDVANDGQGGEGDNVSSTVENVTTGSGDDVITGSAADNVLNGGAGNDTIDGLRGADDIQGGSGTGDTVVYSGRAAGETLFVSLDGSNLSGTRSGAGSEGDTIRGDVENLTTGDSRDFVTGNSLANVIRTGGGDDTVTAAGGNDRIETGAGNDTINAGAGDDSIQPGTGADDVHGGADTNEVDYSERTAPVTVSFDNVANDGEAGEGDNVHDDVQTVKGATTAPAPSNNPGPAPSNNPGPAPSNNPGPAPSNNPGPAPSNDPAPAPSNNPAPAQSGDSAPAQSQPAPVQGSSTQTTTVDPTTTQKQGTALEVLASKAKRSRSVLVRGRILVKARNGVAQSSAAACGRGGKVLVTLRKGNVVVGKKLVTLSSTCTFQAPVTLKAGTLGKLKVEVRFLGNRALKATKRTTSLQVNG